MCTETIKERQEFLKVYTEFDKWLNHHDFIQVNTTDKSSPIDYHYKHYDDHIDSMYGVERFCQVSIKLELAFIRDKNKHSIMFIGTNGRFGTVRDLKIAKDFIFEEYSFHVKTKLSQLQRIQQLIDNDPLNK